ncbi:MAG: hypothetical protein OEU59_03675, partial [Gammaproteobacteria bacterium]|nr:hypothetical protein [Gammaproteobacteria bacterium]
GRMQNGRAIRSAAAIERAGITGVQDVCVEVSRETACANMEDYKARADAGVLEMHVVAAMLEPYSDREADRFTGALGR